MSCVFVMSSHAQVRMFFRRWQIFLLDSDHLTCTSASCSCQWKNQNPIWATLYSGFARFLHELWFLLLSLFDYSDKLNAGTIGNMVLWTFFNANTFNVLLGFSRGKKLLFQTKMIKKIQISKCVSQETKVLVITHQSLLKSHQSSYFLIDGGSQFFGFHCSIL